MKKLLLFTFSAVISAAAVAQDCTQLFISEYVVGTGNNKAYELYNPTPEPINLAGYVMERWSNGEQGPTDQTILAGTIPAYGTWVVANGQTEDIPLSGGFISPAADPDLQALADQLDGAYPAPTYMNGNDALVFVLNEEIICDIFGVPGQDPGQAWTDPAGNYITTNHTMIRKPWVKHGITTLPTEFQPLVQWDTLGADDWSNLGTHFCGCDPATGVKNLNPTSVEFYPNPVGSSNKVTILADQPIYKVEIYDITGKLVRNDHSLIGAKEGELNISTLNAGVYILNVYLTNNVTYSTKVVRK